MMERKEVKQKIIEAFSEKSPPAKENVSSQYTQYPHCEQYYVQEYFADKPWPKVTYKELLEHHKGPANACLSFMSEEGFRYFFPAFMLISIDEYDIADVSADSAISALLPSEDAELHNWRKKRMHGFSQKQIKAILLFLEYMQDQHSNDYPTGFIEKAIKAIEGS